MKYIEAVNEYETEKGEVSIFLAGGITNCPDWQSDIVKLFQDSEIADKLVVFNPRRKHFPIEDPNASQEQIEWEWRYLDNADMILFWFSRGSLNPIVLFEYGKWLMNLRPDPIEVQEHETRIKDENQWYGLIPEIKSFLDKPIFVGIDPDYARRRDVEIQTQLENPILYEEIVYSLYKLVERIISHVLITMVKPENEVL